MKARILELFENITVNDLSYCLLCFKTSQERKISVSRNFTSFLEALNFNINLQWTNIAAEEKTTCYICEAKLEKAASLVKIIKNGIRMKNLLNYCQEYRKTNSLLNTCLNSNEPVEQLRNRHPMFTVAYECQKNMADIKRQTELETTEILTVDTSMNSQQPTPMGYDDDVVLIESTASIISDVQKPGSNIATTQKQNINKTNKVPIKKLATNSRTKKQPTDLPTEPKIKSTNSLREPARPSSPVAQNPILLNSLMTPQKPLLVNNADVSEFEDKMIARQRPDGNFELHKIVIGTDGVPYIPTLPAKLVNGQIVMINQVGVDPVNTLPQDQLATIVLDPDMNISVAKGEGVKKRRIELESEESQRLMKPMHTTDWEDKIPMDVITYVDATDPHMSSNIMQREESILPDFSIPQPSKVEPGVATDS